jgi:hypothetical protein
LTVDVGEVSEERPEAGDSAGESEGGSEGESEGDEDDHDDDNDDDEGEEFMDDDDDDDDPRAASRNGHRLSNASAMSSNGSVTSAGNNNNGDRSSSASGGPASLDARAQLAANLLLLQGTELGHVLMTLERECPAALEVNDAGQQQSHSVVNGKSNKTSSSSRSVPEKLEIVLDVLDGALFTKIATYASEKATIRKRGMAAAAGSAAVAGDITINDISGKRRRRK